MRRYSLRQLFAAATAAAIVFGAAGVLYRFWDGMWISHPRGAVASREKWHPVLIDLLTAASSDGVAIDNVEVFGLGSARDIRELWKWDAAPGAFDWLATRWELTPLAADGVEASALRRIVPSDWYGGQLSDKALFFASPRWLSGEDADAYLVAHDVDRRLILIWFSFDH